MSTLSPVAMDVNTLMGNGTELIRNHQPDLMGGASKTATVMDRMHYYQPSSGGGDYAYYGGTTYHKGGGKRSIALTALTLLAFLFFLHILQNCIQEQTDMMNPQVLIMQAKLRAAQREAEANKRVGQVSKDLVDMPLKSTKPVKSEENRQGVLLGNNGEYQYTKLTGHVPLKTIQRTD